jgi:hypothetical protein
VAFEGKPKLKSFDPLGQPPLMVIANLVAAYCDCDRHAALAFGLAKL